MGFAKMWADGSLFPSLRKYLPVVGNYNQRHIHPTETSMDILFSQTHTYTVNDSIENVQANITSIVNKKWQDFSENITENITEDNNFKLTHKWSFAVIKWIENSPAYLSGTLSADNKQTVIKTTVRPNSGLVIFFYILIILFLCELFGINTFIQGPKTFKLLFFPFFNLILFGLMKMFTAGLRNRFERIMHLKHGE